MAPAISRDRLSPDITHGVIVTAMRGRPPAEPIKEYPNRLREWRTTRTLSQKQLGDLVGEKYQTVARHETGENQITLAQMKTYARALSIKPEELLNDSDRINPRLRALAALFDVLSPERQDDLLRVTNALAEPAADFDSEPRRNRR